MEIQELAAEYRSRTDEELLLLATNPEQLTPEANAVLNDELARRQIGSEQLNCLREEEARRKDERGRSRTDWQILWFLPHLAAVYVTVKFCTPWLAGWTRGTLLPLFQHPTLSGSFEFLFSHIFTFSFIPAFVFGLANARFKHKVAYFVWLVPAAILTYKLATFPAATSVLLRSQSWPAFHHYFGGGFVIPEYRDWQEFWQIVGSNADMRRGMTQLNFTAPFYAGVAYSLAAWISLRTALHRKVMERLKQWEEWKFGNRADDSAPD